jgi:predicted AAA+ superfamily ATPase
MDLSEFFSIQTGLISRVTRQRKRFLAENINWEKRMMGIYGARGTGKTTMLLQHLAARNRQKHLLPLKMKPDLQNQKQQL